MVILVRAGRHRCKIWLWLRCVTQRQRKLNTNRSTSTDPKSYDQKLGELLHGRRMARALWTHADDKTMNELDLLVREMSRFDELIVFDAPQGADPLGTLSWCGGHGEESSIRRTTLMVVVRGARRARRPTRSVRASARQQQRSPAGSVTLSACPDPRSFDNTTWMWLFEPMHPW